MPSTSKLSITIILFAVRILQDSHPDPLPPGPIHPEPRPNPTRLIPHRSLPQPTSAGVKLWHLWSGDRSLEFWHTPAHTATHAHTRGQAPGSAHALRDADTHTYTHTHTQTDTQTHRHTNKQTHNTHNTHTHTHTHNRTAQLFRDRTEWGRAVRGGQRHRTAS